MIAALLKEIYEFISEQASGELTTETAKKKAAALKRKMEEQLSDALLLKLDTRIAEVMAEIAAEGDG